MEPDGAGPDRGVPPLEDSATRTWVHPSEFGLHSRTRTDRRRGVWLSAGLVLGGIGLLLVGTALGLDTSSGGPHRPPAMEAITASLAQVTVVHGTDRRAVTGVLLDDGHVAVRADGIEGADEVWVSCAGKEAERATRIATDPRSSLSVVTIADGDSHAAIHDRATAPGEVVIVARVGVGEAPPTVERSRVEATDTATSVPRGSEDSTTTSESGSAGIGLDVVLVRIGAAGSGTAGSMSGSTIRSVSTTSTTSGSEAGVGPASTERHPVADGAAFDTQGRFVGLVVRDDGTHREMLSAPTVVQVAAALSR